MAGNVAVRKAVRRGWRKGGARRTVASALAVAGLLAPALGLDPALAADRAPARASGPATGPRAGAPNASGSPAPAPRTPAQPRGLSMVRDGFGPSSAQRAAMMAASSQARKTGQPVAVAALMTATTMVTAQPGGGFTMSDRTVPVRTRVSGSWVPVDLRLHRNSDGTYSPAATAYGRVRLSGGGRAPLAVTRSGPTAYAVIWPRPLPAPDVAGSTAAYRNVLPGVDLVVSATPAGGFSDVLVVKTPAAARNPALSRLTLATRVTGGRAVPAAAPDGIAVASSADGMVLESATPLMWDSRTKRSLGRRGGVMAADPSDAASPGVAARIAIVATRVTRSALSLIPDQQMLASHSTVYPVYLDPTTNWHNTDGGTPAFDETKQGSPCNGVSLYDQTDSAGDNGQLGVGYMGFAGGCEGDMHSYYQWKLPKVLWGSDVHLATVNAQEVYSATCASTSYTVDLHQSGTIGSGTDWNNRPGWKGVHTTASFGPACTSNPSNGFTVTSAISSAASGHAASFTAALTEDSYESARNDVPFKRFADNPDLQIQYNLTPGVPAPSAMSAVTGADNAGCDTTAPYPYIGATIATNAPVLKAKISDPDGDKLQATFKYWIDGQSTTHTGLSGDNLSSGSTASLSLPSSFTSAFTNGETVDWQVLQVSDGLDASNASAVCHFMVEPNADMQPSVTSVNGLYPDIDNGGGTGAAAGTTGQFTLTNTGTATATKFAYSMDVPPPTTNPPACEVATAAGNSATVSLAPLSPGPHTLWVAAIDAAGDASSMFAYRFEAAGDAPATCASLAACFDNVAISPDSAMSQAAADGSSSYSATDLASAGWASGGAVTVDGAHFTLPSYGGAGQNDNILAANQTITYSYPVPVTGSSALMFLASATYAISFGAPGAVDGTTSAPYVPAGTGIAGTYCFDSTDPSAYCPPAGTINYTDGTSQPYSLVVPDWVHGPPSLAAVVLPHENRPTGQVSTSHPSIYPLSIPLAPGKTVASVTLPDVGNHPYDHTQALHIFAMSTRSTTTATVEANGTTATAPAGQSWTGAWANPTEGSYNFQGSSFSSQTFRIALEPSISGSTVRIKLDNALGTSKLVIGKATVALDSAGPSAVPSGTVDALTFGGAAGVTIPEGGMAYSDPLTFAVTANQYLLVSFDVTNSVPDIVEHSWANTAYTYLSAPGSGDHTADTTGTAFSGTGTFQGWFTDLLTDVDVTTSGIPTQAVLGDGLIDAWQPNTEPIGSSSIRLSDDLAAAEPTTAGPYGTIAEGIESNQIMTDNPETYNGGNVGGPSALSRIDRDILDQPGLTTVVLVEGLDDVLNGQSADNLDANGYTALLSYLQSNNITVIAIGLTACDGYTGDGATGNSANDPCTATVDSSRTAVNDWLSSGPDEMNPWSAPALFYIDADAAVSVTNPADGLQELHPSAAISDKVNLTDSGYAALASAYLGPQNTWLLNDGTGSTVALDTASNTTNPFVLNSAGIAQDAALSATGATWATDSAFGTVLAFDGATGDAVTSGPALITNQSFSVSAWAKLTDATSYRCIIGQDATTVSGFKLEYSHGSNAWQFVMPETDSSTTSQVFAGNTAPTLNAWTHLVGVYNAATGTARIYVNGALAGTGTVPAASWTATGPVSIGRTKWNGTSSDWFEGDISDVQAWNYALTPSQITALYQQIS